MNILVVKYFRTLIKHYIYVISSYLPKNIYMYIYLHLFILPSLKFFFSGWTWETKLSRPMLVLFFYKLQFESFFIQYNYMFIINSQKAIQRNTYPKGICQAFHVLILDSTKWHYGIIGIRFLFSFFKVVSSSLLLFS